MAPKRTHIVLLATVASVAGSVAAARGADTTPVGDETPAMRSTVDEQQVLPLDAVQEMLPAGGEEL
eukprot:COSAG04_NODE_11814_length_687_cov_0.858844_1_plen_65_part_10